MVSSSFDLESLVHLEQTFFDAGYADGHAHGRTHGLIEGRAIGREKGYELWEEVGFYEGFARLWAVIRQKDNTAESRTEGHIRHLLDLVSQFPSINPSAEQDTSAQVDVAALLSKIRARYKALCASLGVRPRLRAAGSGVMAEVLKKGEAPRGAAAGKVWPLQGRQGSTEMSF